MSESEKALNLLLGIEEINKAEEQTELDKILNSEQFFKSSKVEMDSEEFVKEHKHLVKVLKTGSKKQKDKEADEQENELDNYLNNKG